jgi:dipeptidase D
VRIEVRGLRGGHSGLNIIDNRANAIKLVTRIVLTALDAGAELDLVSIDGGSKHNAIPRETVAVCRLLEDSLGAMRDVVERCAADFREEFGSIEPGMEVSLEELEDIDDLALVLNAHARDRLLRMLDSLPHGVLAMSREVPGLVETSNNLAVIQTEGEQARLITSHRSSVMPALHAVRSQVRSVCLQAGAEVSLHDAYPGWKPNPESPLVKKAIEVYEAVFGSKPQVKAIHAGLECGLLLEKIPGMDAVSIGPEIENAHSPEERVQISSVERFYRHLKALLAELAG